ncbi:MAG: C25 family cysteine peptidase [Ferruginibacter sp.]
MKKILFALTVFIAMQASAQLNNSWIDYSKTYYKFTVYRDSYTRIPQSTLAAAGLASVNADHFQLWRNGEQVRLYTSVSNAVLGASDYIEFWGKMNDGLPDKNLYRNTDYQLNEKYSLETDTATYYLTVNTAGNNLRYAQQTNTAPSAATPDAYYMNTVDTFYKNRVNRGLANPAGEYVYSSSYDMGEGWTSGDISPSTAYALACTFTNLNVYTGGPTNNVSVSVNAAGNSPFPRNLFIQSYNTTIFNEGMPYFEYKKVNLTNQALSTVLPNANTVLIRVGSQSDTVVARIVVAKISITYPATFNFNNKIAHTFEVVASATGNYLDISNFNYGSAAPVLYDLTANTRYVGEISSTPGRVKFVLPPSTAPHRLILMAVTAPNNISALSAPKTFVNYGNAAQQGDYLFISHPQLYNDGNGNNYVEQYRAYRASANGGSFNAKIYNIDELAEQFAFGIKGHPASVRDFIRYARQQFTVAPKYVLLVGRGVSYTDVLTYQASSASAPVLANQNFVPTFGWPASDNLLAANPGTTFPLVPIGRLSAVNGSEINSYLQKVIEYEQVQRTQSPYVADKGWMKNIMHVIGGKDSLESNGFEFYMNRYKTIAEDTLYGGKVETFKKTTAGVIEQSYSNRIVELINNGLGYIGYFGHSSANVLEFNLSNPNEYTNPGKYPFFNASGCSAGNFYFYDPLRPAGSRSISENYILTPQRGSIVFLASTHFGIPYYLDNYNTGFYNRFSKTMYGQSCGVQLQDVIRQIGGENPNPGLNFFDRIHLEEITIHGDPAIKINTFAQPDYAIEESMVRISPTIVSVANVNFNLKVKMQNLGKATNDSIWVYVKRKLPNDSIRTIYDEKIRAIRNTDSLEFTIPISPTTDKGLNQIIVELDYKHEVNELYETNNKVTKDFYIFEDELRPTYPYNFSIINQQNITYVANTANPLGATRQYTMEIDTTELFNSAFKKTYNTTGPGGIVEFTPTNLTFTDSTVYYWRVSLQPVDNSPVIWNTFSFVYLVNSSTGFNQSHYYQHLKSTYDNIQLKEDRRFYYPRIPRNLVVRTGLHPYVPYDKINVSVDFTKLEDYGCVFSSLQVYVVDSSSLQFWENYRVNATTGRYGSAPPNCSATDTARYFFEYPYANPGGVPYRKRAMDLLNGTDIPNGKYVIITNLGNSLNNTSFISQWQADQALYGTGNSLYHTLKNLGFTKIDSFTRNLPFMFMYQKGVPSFTPIQVMGDYDSSYIDQVVNLQSLKPEGTIESPAFGPAREWTALHWRGTSLDAAEGDSVKIQVVGVQNNGNSTLLATVAPSQDTSLTFIDAETYPYVKLRMINKDDKFNTPHQLRYWRINAQLAPEGAVAPNLLYSISADTVDQGQQIDVSLAFKNISNIPFDSLLKIKLVITDNQYVNHEIVLPKRKILVAGDTIIAKYTIDTRNYSGHNTLLIDFNPDFDQPEQLHYNNVLYKDFYVRADNYNPLLDVTFDGVHILNNDIVSSKPNILVKLKDESKYLALSDTALLKVQVRYPDQSLRDFHFGDSMIFTPANLTTGENTATIDFKPYFADDGEYELLVSGKDMNGNRAGDLDYRIGFTVINKPMISNLLNYPNPFTTSTAFVFTVTGSQPPQNMRIQILTITGKVVREITMSELGPIHVGRNITEFKWDGTDMYGQKLANGVYLYRVLTNLNGKSLEKYRAEGDNTDKYFNKGYGKMYLMR